MGEEMAPTFLRSHQAPCIALNRTRPPELPVLCTLRPNWTSNPRCVILGDEMEDVHSVGRRDWTEREAFDLNCQVAYVRV